jgi:hypothetical protein
MPAAIAASRIAPASAFCIVSWRTASLTTSIS